MSLSFKAREIRRCPLCLDWRQPAHVGDSVLVCEGCGGVFRVVHATSGKTGKKLGERIKREVKWR